MSEKKKVQLNKPMTWAGVNYSAGSVEIPAAAADYAIRRGFCRAEKSKKTETEEAAAAAPEKVKPGLPEDFPMRHVFQKLGLDSVEEIQAKSREDLIALDGIADKTADKILAYGK